MTVAEFIHKWRKVELKERSAAQEHFLDLCHLIGAPRLPISECRIHLTHSPTRTQEHE